MASPHPKSVAYVGFCVGLGIVGTNVGAGIGTSVGTPVGAGLGTGVGVALINGARKAKSSALCHKDLCGLEQAGAKSERECAVSEGQQQEPCVRRS